MRKDDAAPVPSEQFYCSHMPSLSFSIYTCVYAACTNGLLTIFKQTLLTKGWFSKNIFTERVSNLNEIKYI